MITVIPNIFIGDVKTVTIERHDDSRSLEVKINRGAMTLTLFGHNGAAPVLETTEPGKETQ